MIHHPPAGARDLLPLEVAQKAWINDLLQAVFQSWGYQRIVTSTLEWLDTLIAGEAIAPATVMQLRDSSGGILGLRPELTASIARAAVTRMTDSGDPQRLCYRANVFRQPPTGYHGKQVEFYQAGVELLFVGGVLADAEILLLMLDALTSVGINLYQVILGEAGLTRSLLAIFPTALQAEIRDCMAHLDFVRLQSLDYPTPELQDWAIKLFDLRGEASIVLEKVSQFSLDAESLERVNNLKSLVEIVNKSQPQNVTLILDLSWLQSFDYYTGIVFQVVSSASNELEEKVTETLHTLGQGGRYDQLLGLYHPQKKALPGVGFSLNIEDLHACLLATEHLPQTTPAIDWLVIPQSPLSEIAAFHYAQNLRKSDPKLRVEIDLGGRTITEIRDYARNCPIARLAWVESEEKVICEDVK